MDTDRPDDRPEDRPDDERDVVEVTADVDQTHVDESVAPQPKSRMVLATLAGLVVVVVGVVAWSVLYVARDREFPGIAVIFALAIGYVLREVSRRTDQLPRIVAALLAVLLCLVGSVAAPVASTAQQYEQPFFDLFVDVLPDTFALLGERHPFVWLIFAAAVLVAYFVAMPVNPKPKKKKKAAEPMDVPPTG